MPTSVACDGSDLRALIKGYRLKCKLSHRIIEVKKDHPSTVSKSLTMSKSADSYVCCTNQRKSLITDFFSLYCFNLSELYYLFVDESSAEDLLLLVM